ncbi:MAG: hypothetical protein ACI4QA_01900 [Candidatus Spyradosoma sp.]
MKQKLFRIFAKNAAFVALFAFFCTLLVAEKAFPQIDEKTDAYFSETMTEAAVAFGTARALNGAISVVKESSVSAEPMGVGVNLALGQVLDPLDDVVERLSDVLFTTIVALSIQKIVYELVGAVALGAVAVLLVGAFVAAFFSRRERARDFAAWLRKAALVLMLVRVALPCTALISDAVETRFFAPRLAECRERLQVWRVETPNWEFEFSEEDDIWKRIKKTSAKTKEIAVSTGDALATLVENAGEIVAVSLEIAGLYVALFIVQVLFLPLGACFLVVKTANRLFASRLPVVLRAPSLGREER